VAVSRRTGLEQLAQPILGHDAGRADFTSRSYPKPIEFEEGRIFPPKAGCSRVVVQRPRAKSVTVSSAAAERLASVQTEHESQIPVNCGAVGLDAKGPRRSFSPTARSSTCRLEH
jgi:hypothetical protein